MSEAQWLDNRTVHSDYHNVISSLYDLNSAQSIGFLTEATGPKDRSKAESEKYFGT